MSTHSEAYRAAISQLTGAGAPYELEVRDGLRRYRTAPAILPEALATGRAHGAAEFLLYEGERWSFEDFFSEADAAAAALLARGIGPGGRVAIAMRNYPEWMAAFVAVVSIGATVVPLNSWGTPADIAFGLEDSGASLVICDEQRYRGLAADYPALGDEAIIARPADPDHPQAWQQVLAPHRGAGAPDISCSGDDIAMIMYTSGTSGRPKGAVSTHDAICQAIVNLECTAIAAAMSNGEAFAAMLERGHPPTALLGIPLFHVSGCHSQFLTCLRGGRRLIIMYKWDPQKALHYIETERATTIAAAPSMLIDLLEAPGFDAADTSSLFALAAAGAATPPLLRRLLREKVPGHFFGTGWGMTETNAQGVSIAGDLADERPGSAGLPHPVVDLEIRDGAGSPCAPGDAGEIWVRSPTTIREYWQRPDANASDFADGWFRSGDIGYLDEDGFLYLSDRAKDMIIRGGENIYPVEIEHVFLELDAVQEVAVVGMPDERMGECVVAILRLRGESPLSEEQLLAHARERLAAYKLPSRIVLREAPFPRNATDKVLKQPLREELLAALS
jgi:acyl-CoA synthetase (AMP-forming)/AMP-acid ligase II